MIKFFVKLNARATIFLKQDSTGKATSSSTRRFVIPRMTYSSIVIHCVSPVYTYCIEGSQATLLLLIKLPFFFTINARRKCNAFLTSIPRVERRGGGTHRGTFMPIIARHPRGESFLLARGWLHGIPIYHRRNALHNLVHYFCTPASVLI